MLIKNKIVIGFPNIFTSFWFLFMITGGAGLLYVSIDRNVFTGDLIFIGKFFLGLFILITTGITIFFVLKFRLLYIWKNKLFIIRPFIFKLQKIDLTANLKYKWSTWGLARGGTYRSMKITGQKIKAVTIGDIEFENFDVIIKHIDKSQPNDAKAQCDLLQAKEELSFMSYYIFLCVLLLAMFACLNLANIFHWIHIVAYLVLLLFIISLLTKRRRYKLIMKK